MAGVEGSSVGEHAEDLLITFRDPSTDELLLWHRSAAGRSRVFFLAVRAELDDDAAVRLVACIASGRYREIDHGRALLVTLDGVETVVA